MSEISNGKGEADSDLLKLYATELEAETLFSRGQTADAVRVIQEMLDRGYFGSFERGWYLQEIARYWYAQGPIKSNSLQVAAHRQNRYLLKPREGMEFTKISLTEQKRIENVIGWIRQFPSFADLSLKFEAILGDLAFGVDSESFEQALHQLGIAMGFECQRPDKEWKEGPDNLWAVRDGQYLPNRMQKRG